MKKLLLTLLALLCLTLPAWAEDASTLVIDGVTFSADGTVLIEYPWDRQDAHYTVPDGVVTIGNGAFFQNEYVTGITLPDSVRVIGTEAFQCCTSLTELNLPYRITALGAGAFAGTKLTTLRIPTSTADLPEGLLTDMPCLTDVYLSHSVRTVGGKTPAEGAACSLVSDDPAVVLHAPPRSEAEKLVRASGNAYVIENWGTESCTLDTAEACLAALPSSWIETADWTVVTDAHGRPAFTYGAEDAFALVTDGVRMRLTCFERYEGEWDWLWSTDQPLFGVEEGLVPMNMFLVEDTLTLFMGWGEKAVEIKAVFDYNGWGSWFVTESAILVPQQGGYSPESTTVYETPQMLHSFVLVQGEQAPVLIEDGVLLQYPAERTDTHYVVPEGVEVIGEYAFAENPYLIHVTLPDSVRIIGDDAFAYCGSLRVVDMPATLEYLGSNAFECTSLQSITIPEGLTRLGHGAFCASGVGGTIVIPEGVTDIGYECFAFGYDITDLYLPASLKTIGGKTFREGAEFWDIWAFNTVDEGETHMTVHAPAGTEAALFAKWSDEPYVIEDAREGTDLPAMTALVQQALDAAYPGAVVVDNHYGFPCVTYSADTVFAFAVLETPGTYTNGYEGLLCCFDRAGDELTLRWVNRELRSLRHRYEWDELDTPIVLELQGDSLYLGLRGDEENAVFLTFSGEDFRLTELESCYWEEDTGGPPAFWAVVLRMPVTDGAPLRDFDPVVFAPQAYRVPGAIFDGDTVLLPLYEVIYAASSSYPFTYEHDAEGMYCFRLGETEYEMNEQAMTLTVSGGEDNLILPAPGADDYRSEIIDGRWMVDANTVYCTFRTLLNWPITIEIDRAEQIVTITGQ